MIAKSKKAKNEKEATKKGDEESKMVDGIRPSETVKIPGGLFYQLPHKVHIVGVAVGRSNLFLTMSQV